MLDYSDPTLDLMKLIQEFSTLLKQVINCLRTPFAGKNAAISCKGPSFTISDTFPSMRVRERFLLTSMSLLLFLGIFDRQTVLLANSGFVLWSANLGSGLRSASAMVSKSRGPLPSFCQNVSTFCQNVSTFTVSLFKSRA